MNRHPKLLGLDLGFGFTKCTDGEQSVIFPSHLCRAVECADHSEDPGEGVRRIELDGDDYIIGDDRSGTAVFENFAREPERLLDDYGRHLALAALADFAGQESPIYLVVGLPVAHLRRWETPLVERLVGYHKVGLHPTDGPPARKNIHVRKLHVVPHPLGAFTNLIMDAEGRRQSSGYDEQKIALVDIGFRTTDVMVMDAARFCHRGSDTIHTGVGNGFESIARRLHGETGMVPNLGRLYQAIGRGYIRIGDQEYNLKNLREETYLRLSKALADRINYALRDEWDLERVVLTGGGASDIAETIAPLISGEVVLVEHDQDARLANAQGQLGLARHMWGASGLCGNGNR
jgi:plasmid segregation protein ParM